MAVDVGATLETAGKVAQNERKSKKGNCFGVPLFAMALVTRTSNLKVLFTKNIQPKLSKTNFVNLQEFVQI